MGGGAHPVIGVAKSFDAGAKKGIFEPKLDGSFPDNTTDGHRVGAPDSGFVFLCNNRHCVGVERVDFVQGGKGLTDITTFENENKGQKGQKKKNEPGFFLLDGGDDEKEKQDKGCGGDTGLGFGENNGGEKQ